MLGYWPYATHKKTNFDIYIYIYIYVYLPQLRRKTRYSKYEIGINSDFKINILENKSLSLSFIFFKKKVSPAGHKKRGRSCSYSWKKAGEYCSSELIHLNSANSKQKNACCEVKRKTDLGTEAKKLQRRWKRDGWSMFICFKSFPPALYLRLFFLIFLSSASSSVPLKQVPALPSSLLQILYAKKWSQDQQVVPAGLWFLFSFSFFLFFLFYCQSSQPHSNTGEWKKLSLFSAFFSSVFGYFFLLFSLCFSLLFLGH